MSNFKIGEKVVFIKTYIRDSETITPKNHEIVEIDGFSPIINGNLYVKGYRINKEGYRQSFKPCNFRKLDHQFGEDVCAEILKKVKEESLILVN